MDLRRAAARQALTYVESGMTLGLGSGSTAGHFVDLLGEQLRAGVLRDIRGIPTSEATAERARRWGIPLTTLTEAARLDLAVDGADEVDPALDLIKGLGRALLREKIVEMHADRFLVVVDESKLVPRLGSKAPLPVELVRFEAEVHLRWLASLGCQPTLMREADGVPAVTDNGNWLATCWFEGGIPDPYRLAQALAKRPGIVEHGLFLGMATAVIVAGQSGVRTLERARP